MIDRKIKLACLLAVLMVSLSSIAYAFVYQTQTQIFTQIIKNKSNYYINQLSNVDSSADKGTHSNFNAQQSGPDQISDTLTEANTTTDLAVYIPITFTNIQISVTPNPFQEKISWNPSSYTTYEASDLGNIRFYLDIALTVPLCAWLESCSPSLSNIANNATAWIRLNTPIVGNGGTLTIYMAFLSNKTDFDGYYWGTAPNLSPSYGQYDNGANVFSFYDNFAGNTISSDWNTAGAAGTFSVNDGLTVNSGAFPGYMFTLNNQYTGPLVIDAYQVGTTGDWSGISFCNLQTTDASYSLTSGAIQWLYPPQGPWGSCNGLYITSGGATVTPDPPTMSLQIITLAVNSTVATEYQNYINPVTAFGTISLTNYPGLVQLAYNTASDTQTTYWFRLRAYPPDNEMPSVSFGSIVVSNYQLDLEEQFVNVDFHETNKELCIYVNSTSTENLRVDVWTGSLWQNVIASLTNGWNNVTISDYIVSSTLTIRFNGSIENNDDTQDSWTIDATVLHLWS